FREDLAVLAAETEVSRTGSMARWGLSAPAGLTWTAAVVFAICALVTVAVAALAFAERLDVQYLLFWFIVEAGIVMTRRHAIRRVLAQVASADRDLALLGELLVRIERESFAAPRLAALQKALLTGGMRPSHRIAQLRRLVSWVDSTRNQLFAPFALAILLPPQLGGAVDRWRAAYGPRVLDWLNVVGELEALASLCTY